jgi:subtilisin family serine protease
MKKHLLEQVERINDEATGERLSVIVQMETGDELTSMLEAATEIIRRRRVTISARDLLPPTAETMEKARGRKATAATRRKISATEQSLSSMIVRRALAPAPIRTLARHGQQALAPLLKSRFAELTTERMARATPTRRRAARSRETVPHFWASAAALLELTRDELRELPEAVPEISEIYLNRTVRVPPVVDVRTLPASVVQMETHVSAWGLQKTGALAAWGAFGKRGEGVKVAVLDTGVDGTHPELKGQLAGFAEFDDRGRSVPGSAAYDSGRHGTHVAGTVVGRNAGGHWIGMAPDARVLGALVLKNGSGTDAQILAGMQWAMEQGADVINMSLGGLRMTADVMDTYTRTIINAVRLGIPVVVAIGNDGHQTSGAPGNDYFAFGVGATDAADRAAGFSGGRTQVILRSRYIDERHLPLVYGKPDVCAPGVAVYSCVPGAGYASWNGTSMATPHVAGAIALMLSATSLRSVEPAQRAFLLQDLLTATVEELGESGQDHRYGFGRIDVLRAIGHAKELGF